IVLTASLEGDLAPLIAMLTITDADSPLEDVAVAYAWDPRPETDWRPLDGDVIAASGLVSGSHVLAFRASDPDGNTSLEPLEVPIQVVIPPSPNLTWLLIGALVTLMVVGAAGVSLRHYPAYAGQWVAARDYPLQQIIPLVVTPGESVDGERLSQRLRTTQAFSTGDQVQDALDGLVERGLMQREGDVYRLVSPWTAQVHRWVQGKNIPTLAERIRTQHPLYARTRDFFTQARFRLEELGAEEFLLTPQGQDHLQAGYGAVYTRLIAGRPPTGDDFTAVCEAARQRYEAAGGDETDMAHRVAMVISDRRPEPGARYRLYEIRQREGLAIVPLDSALFGQIKPNRTASDILAAEIDQATGQQNLYAISGPVSGDLSFFGRERVLQEIIDLLDAGQPVGLFGLRKVGKTSLIQRLQGRLDQRRPIAFVDTQTTVRQQGVWPLYPAIVAAFVAHLQRTRSDLALPDLRLWPEAGSLSPAMAESFLQDLRALHATLAQPGEKERMLLIVDEIDRLLPAGRTE
ncbi:MAG: ATP-binding protein, partial [Chloroflexi bacterium]|nr:ATP-binding protein [Chloroflexota bacterium]